MLPTIPKIPAHAVVMISASLDDISNGLRAAADQLEGQNIAGQVLAQPVANGKRTGSFLVTGDDGAYASITIVMEA